MGAPASVPLGTISSGACLDAETCARTDVRAYAEHVDPATRACLTAPDYLLDGEANPGPGVQELSGTATQIMVAVEQISRGAQQQAAATHQASSAVEEMEKTAASARERSMLLTRACAYGERRIAACSIPGSWMSAV